MNLLEIYGLRDNMRVQFEALVTKVETKNKQKDGKPYLQLTIQDASDKIDFPIWDDYDMLNGLLKVGDVVSIDGQTSKWEGKLQIKNPGFEVLLNQDIDFAKFVPSYVIPQKVYDYFNFQVDKMENKWKQIVMGLTGCGGYDGKRWKEFTTCVSAEKHHGNKRGGLLLHSVGVLRNVNGNIYSYIEDPLFYDAKEVINVDRLRTKAIIHDIAKPLEYDYNGIIRYKPDKKVDHTVEGVFLLKQVNSERGEILTPEDIEDVSYSIMSHHGQWGKFEPKSLEDWILHTADLIDARIVGEIEGKKK